jgi:hypothetical protein
VCKHRAESDVTNTLDALNTGVELVVNDDTASFINLSTDGLKVQALRVWPATDSNKDNIGINLE